MLNERVVDILIIGAGPAGLSASIEASKKGEVEVLIVEKENKLAKKPCGEAVSAATLRDLEVKPDRNIVRNEIRGVLVFAPNGKDYVEISSRMGEGYIINKRALLETLAIRARRNGALLWINSPVVDYKVNEKGFVEDVIISKRGELIRVKPKIVIACDGIGSKIGRAFFRRKEYEVIPTAQYILNDVELIDKHVLEIRVGTRIAPGGYLWIFPREEEKVGIGAGVRGDIPRRYIDKFIEENFERFKRSVELEFGVSAVPISGQVKERVKGNVMLCGDAAGQVIPLTGGGIHSASIAGKIAGRIAREAIVENNITYNKLKEYVSEYDKYWGIRISRSLKVLRVVERLNDNELNELARILEGKDIIDLANGLNVKRVAQKLMKHPVFFAKIARALL